jgi:DNA-binding MarR family transcriptional regulator
VDKELLQMIIERYEEVSFTVNRRLNALIRKEMADELTLDQYSTLRYIRKHGSCTSSELSDIFCVGKSSITAIITRLFDKQLIARMPDEKDRRVTYLTLTTEGEHMMDEMEKRIQETLARIMNHFDKQEAVQFIKTFEKLAVVLTEQEGKVLGDRV